MKKVRVNRRISEDVLREILLRLSIKECLKCKLVCKAWYNTIMDPYFSTDFQRSRFTSLFYRPPNVIMLVELNTSYTTPNVAELGYLKVGVVHKTMFRSNFVYPDQLDLGNVCNGVICYCVRGDSNFYIRNLMTNQRVTIVGSSYVNLENHWLGFSSMSHRFKLLLTHHKGGEVGYTAEIKTIGVDENWRNVEVAPCRLGMHPHSLSVNDCVHWYSKIDDSIWSFDFEDEVFLQVPLPDEIDVAGSPKIKLATTFESKICLCCCLEVGNSSSGINIHNYFCEIWVMKEYGVRDSWVKQYAIPTGGFRSVYTPLMEMDSGKVLMRSDDDGVHACVIYNPTTGGFKELMVLGLPHSKSMASRTYGVRFSKI